MVIERNAYLQKLIDAVGLHLVKIITGPRRSGKSTLLFTLFADWLRGQGVDEDHIVTMKLDRVENARYRDVEELASYFEKKRVNDGKTQFFLIDEIQFCVPKENPWVKGQFITFYDVLNQFLDHENIEIYVTGSNSHLLSRDIATEFRGRGWQIRMRPLSFSEFLSTKEDKGNFYALWDEYWRYGGLPQCVLAKTSEAKIEYLRETFLVTYLRDIIERNRFRKDEATLETVTRILATSIGSPVSLSNIANTFRSVEKANLSPATVKAYLSAMEDAFLVNEVGADSLKGRKFIGANPKYYFEDLGLRNAASGFRGESQESHCMENVIYNELVTRGYVIHSGRLSVNELVGGKQQFKQYEVDFVCEKDGDRVYVQSAMEIPDERKMAQEKRPLLLLKDSFRKVLVSKSLSGVSRDDRGILEVGLYDFLTNPKILG